MVLLRAISIVLLLSSQYPQGLQEFKYLPNFAARGLHYDIQKVRFRMSPRSKRSISQHKIIFLHLFFFFFWRVF